ncbi:sigma-70 family RNA polymerase sigma factor [Solibacillus sp. FSL H8-0538]|uniref:sigma-70 family RNA polymerase sigma factor n=1 Tax=Solibacillus sp. FSL H8-0538 TaxID=2921400 RepID=UPI0030F87720
MANEMNFIKRLKKQNEDALEYVIEEYMPLVKAIALKVLQPMGQASAVDDCINEVFLDVWKHAQTFQGDAVDFKKWIAMVAKYKAIDHYRIYDKRASREQTIDTEPLFQTVRDTQDTVLAREQRNELLFEVAQLDELDRDIFMMKYYLDMKNAEIAETLAITKAAVDNRLYRGKQKLAKSLALKERYV